MRNWVQFPDRDMNVTAAIVFCGCCISFHILLYQHVLGKITTQKKDYSLIYFYQILSAWLQRITQRLVYSHTMKVLFGPMDGACMPLIIHGITFQVASRLGNSRVQLPAEKFYIAMGYFI